MPIENSDLENWFSHHTPKGDQALRYDNIRKAALKFAAAIVANSVPSADQTAAVRKVREAMMAANAGIACNEVHSEGTLL